MGGTFRHDHGRRTSAGFTLIELMIVVAIIAILTTLAVAGYAFATTKARRGAAEGCLTQAAQFMERYYTTNLTYKNAPAPAGQCASEATDFYTIAFSGVPDTTFTITATPISGKQDDERCGTLSITNTGTKGATGPGGVAGCW